MSYINNLTPTESLLYIINHVSKYFNNVDYDMLLALFNYNYTHMYNMIFIMMLHMYHTYIKYLSTSKFVNNYSIAFRYIFDNINKIIK